MKNLKIKQNIFLQDKVNEIIKSLKNKKGSLALSQSQRNEDIEYIQKKHIYKQLTQKQKDYIKSII